MFKFGFSADDLEDNSMAEDSTDPTALIDDGGEPVSDLNQGQFARFAELSVDELVGVATKTQ